MNDERPIEKLLRRHAKKRRDEAGDPLVLHPATRRLLQGQVARQYPKSSAAEGKNSGISFLALLARRWTYAVGILVVLCVSAAVLLPPLVKSKSRSLLAQKETESLAVREGLAPEVAPTLSPATPPAEAQSKLAVAEIRQNQPVPEPSGGGNLSRRHDESVTLSYAVTNGIAADSYSRFADAKTDTGSLRTIEAAKKVSLGVSIDTAAPVTRSLSAPAPPRSAGETVPTSSLSLADAPTAGRENTGAAGFREKRQATTPPPAVTATSTVVSTGVQDKNIVARGGGVERESDRFYSQSFANVAPEPVRVQAAKVKAETIVVPVLANFQVQNVGNELRVIDSDGSTYRGIVSAEVVSQAGIAGGKDAVANYGNVNAGRAQIPADARAANQQAPQNFLWRVEGTNRTLNQNVVFTFNFVETTNNLAASQLKAASALNQDATKLPSQFPTLLNNSVINGRAQLGPAQQIEVNAVPVKP